MNDESLPADGNLTREQVFNEMQKIVTDPNHPQHAGWSIRSESAENYVNSLYKRLPGAIGDSVPASDSLSSPIVRDAPSAPTMEDAGLRSAVEEKLTQRGINQAEIKAE